MFSLLFLNIYFSVPIMYFSSLNINLENVKSIVAFHKYHAIPTQGQDDEWWGYSYFLCV